METSSSVGSLGPHTQPPGPPAILRAAEKFEKALHSVDISFFRTTTLEDVKATAEVIERDQEQRRCMRNLNRIEPLFQTLRRFGAAIDILCQGTPFLPYIWAPIKLLLQIADEYTVGFTRLVDAYDEIARHLPRFERLGATFSQQLEFQATLADVYADILEFHTCTYKFLRRSGWKHLFDSSWKGFEPRFNTILRNLAKNQDLLDREANSLDILEAKAYRQRSLEELGRNERARQDWQLRDTLAWLDLKGQDQEQQELFDRCKSSRLVGTCEWILNHPKITLWLDPDDCHSFIWLRSKPGAGKTTLATFLVDEASISPDSHILYCLCTYGFGQPQKNACSLIFRSLIAQLLRKQPDLLCYIYENYVRSRTIPSLVKVKELLKKLLETSERIFLILDGLDELQGDDQKQVLAELGGLSHPTRYERSIRVKVLVCSRETKEISRKLSKSPCVALSEEESCVQRDISLYARHRLRELRDRFCNDIVDALEEEVVEKAKGMFLWEESLNGLRAAIRQLPSGLPGVYKLILDRIKSQASDQQQQRIQQILMWLSFSFRSLKATEICSAIVFHTDGVLNAQSKLGIGVLDICKPLIEEREDATFALIHHSAREFLLHRSSGPFMSPATAHRHIVTSCIKYLITCREFLSGVASPRSYGHIVKGFHVLYPYVQEFWPEHFLNASHGKKDEQTDPVLLDQLSRLEMTFWRCQGSSSKFMPIPQNLRTPRLIDKYLDYRKATSGQACNMRDNGQSDIEQDPTLLSEAHSSFQVALESLINGSIPYTWDEMKVTSADLDEFRQCNQQSSFCCRVTGCVWTSVGFATQQARDEHETVHQKRRVCEDPSCDFAYIGFRIVGALRKHVRRYHTTEADIGVPEFPLLPSRRTKTSQSPRRSLSVPLKPEDATSPTKAAIGQAEPPNTVQEFLDGQIDKSDVKSARSSVSGDSRHSSIIFAEGFESWSAYRNAQRAARRRDEKGRTYLARACHDGNLKGVRIWCRNTPEDLNAVDYAGNTPLQVAALHGFAEIVEFLLEQKCDVNTCNDMDGSTPLIDAVENGHVEVVRLLLKHEANPGLTKASGHLPYDLVPIEDPNHGEIRKLLDNALNERYKEFRKSLDIVLANELGRSESEEKSDVASDPGITNSNEKVDYAPKMFRMGESSDIQSLPSEADESDLTPSDPLEYEIAADSDTKEQRIASEDPKQKTVLARKRPTQEDLRRCVENGDLDGVGSILSVRSKVEPETLILAAETGHEGVMQLMFALGQAHPDPAPIRELPAGYNTPMLAAIGRGHPAIVELLVQQTAFNPRRTIDGVPYHEIAAQRMGTQWRKEYEILKRAYDGALKEEDSGKRSSSVEEYTDYPSTPKQRRLVTGKELRASRRRVDPDSDMEQQVTNQRADVQQSVRPRAIPKRRRLVTGKEFRASRRIIDDDDDDSI